MNRLMATLLVLSATLFSCFGLAWAQNVKVDAQQTQLLLAASSTDTLQKELDQAGALGFRPIMGTTRGNGEIVLLLERDRKTGEKFQLRLIATNATGTFQKEISDAALQGFRASPRTFLNKSNEIVVVMERAANRPQRYEYKLLGTNQTSTLESEWVVATSQAYKAAAVITRTEVMLLMEREATK